MAYYFDQDDNKDPNQTSIDASKPSSVISNGQIAPETAAASTATANNARTNPGNFVGISQYLDANKPQAQKLADQVGGVITNSADAAKNELKTKVSDTEKQINDNTVNYDQNALNPLYQDPRKADVDRIQSLQNASYKGPTTLGSIDSLAKAKQNAANANTEEGRRELVSSLYQNQPLKKGALSFDNLLLQANQNAQNTLLNAQKQADVGGIEKNISDEKGRLEGLATAAKKTTDQTAKDTNTKVLDAQKAFEGSLGERVRIEQETARKNAQATLDRLTGKLPSAGLVSNQDLNLLGVNNDQYNQLVEGIKGGYVDPNSLGAVIKDAGGINAANVATPEDYARYNVLKRLAGGGDFLGDDASQAGTYNADLLDYNFNAPVKPVAVQAPRTTIRTDGGDGNVDYDPNRVNTGVGGADPNTSANIASYQNPDLSGATLPDNRKPLRTDLVANNSYGGGSLNAPYIEQPSELANQSGQKLRQILKPDNFPLLGGYRFY